MNTFMTLQSYGSKSAKANLAVQKRIQSIENSISTTKEDSFIYKLNHNCNSEIQVDNDALTLIQFGKDISEKTDGALNIALYPVIKAWGFTTGEYRIPETAELSSLISCTNYKQIQINNDIVSLAPNMEIDLGALGKGSAGDEALKILKEYGIKSALLDLGGNIQALGTKTDGNKWTIGIKSPWGDGNAVAGVKIDNQAVVTSGGYERFFTGEDGKNYIHIFDGKTGMPVENDIASVTIIAHSGLYADALSTSLFVMGLEKAVDFWKKNQDFEMIIITKDKKLYFTASLKEDLIVKYNFLETNMID